MQVFVEQASCLWVVDHFAIVALSSVKVLGDVIGIVRQVVDFVDVFVSRYLALTTAAYITFKFLHFRVFP